ncbi:hypothetical protein Zmor_027515 [Zophobas morio]|uniref:Uncharacterized protein n=1 Tax=Zophobas morio TaxID=2755281 RepID=A0AA38HPG2_9CUCU|nr:hypothetical protein Zmor_027515 [Zophobas morio]
MNTQRTINARVSFDALSLIPDDFDTAIPNLKVSPRTFHKHLFHEILQNHDELPEVYGLMRYLGFLIVLSPASCIWGFLRMSSTLGTSMRRVHSIRNGDPEDHLIPDDSDTAIPNLKVSPRTFHKHLFHEILQNHDELPEVYGLMRYLGFLIVLGPASCI